MDDVDMAVTGDEVREIALRLPRAYEALVRDRVKYRVGRIVFAALSRDQTVLGFGFPKEEREALVASDPVTFRLPAAGDMRYHWIEASMDALDREELEELLVEAWAMCVPKKVSSAWFADHP